MAPDSQPSAPRAPAGDLGDVDELSGPQDLMRLVVCGSVDDGKSTLIGRLLFEAGAGPDDEYSALGASSGRPGAPAAGPDLSLLLDGLAAEREQGITIDVAYRHFSSSRRRFIVADAPGHVQYTRNMVTGATTADVAVILVDASKGLSAQTCRHSVLVNLVGIRQVVLVVNKMDLVDHSQEVFEGIVRAYRAFAEPLSFTDITAIAVVALRGDNVTTSSARMPWYDGPTLLRRLETLELDSVRGQSGPLRLPVQWVNRPHPGFRGYCGLIASGAIHPGDRVRVMPSGRENRVARLVAMGGDLARAVAGQSVNVTLEEEMDVARGDMIVAADAPPEVADQFECTLVWMTEAPMLPGRSYLLKIGSRSVVATITELKYRLDVTTMAKLAARQLELNDIGVCKLSLAQPIAFDPYARNRDTGGLILIDRDSHDTLAGGMLHFALRRSHNILPQALDVDRSARAAIKGHKPMVLWFTGLSGAGKSTLANLVEKKLHALGRHTALLDGDNLRHGLNRDLGFTAADRVENVRRVAEVARLMADAGLIVLVALISPFRAERAFARSLLPAGEFVEIFVDAPLAWLEARDPKGLYARARRGEIENFTGISSPYEPPQDAEIRIDSQALSAEAAAERVIERVIEALQALS